MTSQNKTKAYKDKAVGNLQETTGKVFNDDSQKVKGQIKKNKGESDLNAIKLNNRADATKDDLQGNLKQTIGKITGNDEQRASGQKQEAKADIKKAANQF